MKNSTSQPCLTIFGPNAPFTIMENVFVASLNFTFSYSSGHPAAACFAAVDSTFTNGFEDTFSL